jgi:hypothetical protein
LIISLNKIRAAIATTTGVKASIIELRIAVIVLSAEKSSTLNITIPVRESNMSRKNSFFVIRGNFPSIMYREGIIMRDAKINLIQLVVNGGTIGVTTLAALRAPPQIIGARMSLI